MYFFYMLNIKYLYQNHKYTLIYVIFVLLLNIGFLVSQDYRVKVILLSILCTGTIVVVLDYLRKHYMLLD